MSIFGSILSAIFKRSAPAAAVTGTTGAAAPAASTPSGGAMPAVDVEAVVSKLASQKKEKLDWRRSIVDLMK